MINLECGSVDVCLAPIIIHLTDHGCNWMNYVFCLDGLYLQTAKNLWHNAICGNFLDYSAQKREPNSIHLLLSIHFLFLCSSQLGLSFLLYPIGLPIVKLFACFITAMLIELSPCIAVHNGKNWRDELFTWVTWALVMNDNFYRSSCDEKRMILWLCNAICAQAYRLCG